MAHWLHVSLLVLIIASPARAVEITRLRTQKVGATTYFLVAVRAPADLMMPVPSGITRAPDLELIEDFLFDHPDEAARRGVLQAPRLVPGDPRTSAVYYAATFRGDLIFFGKRTGARPTATCRLIYPTKGEPAKGLAGLPGDRGSKELDLQINWKDAKNVEAPTKKRHFKEYPAASDFAGCHAWAQAQWYASLEFRAPQAGLFTVARQLTGRKYDVWAAPLARESLWTRRPGGEIAGRPTPDLYSLFTGAAHLDEAVMLHRLRNPKDFASAPRTVNVDTLPKVTLAEHDWKKMMAGKKPAAEPLAKLVPHDCYYLTMNSLASFRSAWEVIDAWGGSVLRPPQMLDRDHGLRARYERQLCLPFSELIKAVPDKTLRASALIGSDLYWADGSDVTVLFDAADRKALVTALADLVTKTTRPFTEVKVTREKYRGASIDGWRTPRREISTYRAVIGDIVICSNSPVAIRRVIDVHAGKAKALADSLDFQYMRTVFVRDAKTEDGFVFLSDAFIRRLVNAPTRIKAMRHSQARAALTLASHAALFAGHETGRLPADTKALLADSGLAKEALIVPDGKSVEWDGRRKQAVSEVFGTLEHGTPLVELKIDKVTEEEDEDFRSFGAAYMRLWMKFFDPVSIRFELQPGKTKVEIFILPLIRSREFSFLRGITSGLGPLLQVPAKAPIGTWFQLHLRMGDYPKALIEGLGDWAVVHLHGEVVKYDLVRAAIRAELNPKQILLDDKPGSPLSSFTLGIATTEPNIFNAAGDKGKERKYRGVVYTEYAREHGSLKQGISFLRSKIPLLQNLPKGLLHQEHEYAMYLDGAAYLSLDKTSLKRRIDFIKKGQKPKQGNGDGFHGVLYLAPPRDKAADGLLSYLDWRAHVKAQSALAIWEGLFAGQVVTPAMSPGQRDAAVRRLLGFVPVSPDGSALTWDAKNARMNSEHHGTLTAPTYRAKLPKDAPLGQLLRQIKSVQAGLRFREDGLHTTIMLDWSAGK